RTAAGAQMSARISKQQRSEARRQWLLEKKDREWREAKLAELAKQGEVTDAQLEELGLVRLQLQPTTEFMRERLRGISPDDPQLQSKYKQATIDLVASDIPLDPSFRRLLAGDLCRL